MAAQRLCLPHLWLPLLWRLGVAGCGMMTDLQLYSLAAPARPPCGSLERRLGNVAITCALPLAATCVAAWKGGVRFAGRDFEVCPWLLPLAATLWRLGKATHRIRMPAPCGHLRGGLERQGIEVGVPQLSLYHPSAATPALS